MQHVANYDSKKMPTDVSIITTYRCQMRCKMCDIWDNPSRKADEITPKELEILPQFKFANITGGEPFVRNDLEDIIEVMYTKADRIVISTSGWHTKKILKLAERFPDIGVRVSIEGLPIMNDELRGREGGFDRGIRTLLGLKEMGVKDIGFGQTVSNKNSHDLLPLYELSKSMDMEFATASFHNSFYFHKGDNWVTNKQEVIDNFHELIERLMKENSPKSWFRAFFNLGLINYIRDEPRMLPCEAGTANFFVEPNADVYPCNGLEERYWKESMGNLRKVDSFEELWFSAQAESVRQKVSSCPKNCWMVGTAAPVMKKYIKHPATWVVKNKIKSLLGKPICIDDIPVCDVGQNPLQGDLRGGDIKDPNTVPLTFRNAMPEEERLALIEEIAVENE
jgi:Fe-coproporphyrin III synthase